MRDQLKTNNKILAGLIAIFICFHDLAKAEEIVFIVNAENPIKEMRNQDVVDIFLKKKREWADASGIHFIDRKDGSVERHIFLTQYIGRSDRDIELYWIGQKLYSGNAAPMQVLTDQNAEKMVSTFKGGMSYVLSTYVLGKGVKKIMIQGNTSP